MTTEANPFSICAMVTITEAQEQAITDAAGDGFCDAIDLQEKVSDNILEHKYAEETCFNHCSWVRLDLDTDDFDVAKERLEDFNRQLTNLFSNLERIDHARL